ncbi:hypothetical protein QJS04_geneDACA023067 [Acorus gramineus]|uniref:Uncharacterized protein n=1 Tax=Acorus gramineus TaxID=55184 RepID=A0AAV9A1G8_ACOGR|nr:hypothetical protein QJS04_geneDACA023067 [Acorus gramineus]
MRGCCGKRCWKEDADPEGDGWRGSQGNQTDSKIWKGIVGIAGNFMEAIRWHAGRGERGFPVYSFTCRLAGIKPRFYDLLPSNNWELNPSQIMSLADSNTIAIIFTNYKKNELKDNKNELEGPRTKANFL